MRDVLLSIRRNRLTIAIIVVVCLAAGLAVALLSPARYQSETKVLFKPTVASSTTSSDAALISQASSLVSAQIPTYTALATTSTVLDPAAKSLNLNTSTSDLQRDVKASTTLDTAIVTITTESSTAKGAAELANAVASSLISEVRSEGSGSASVTIDGSVVEAPIVPNSPYSPNLLLDLLVGLAVGVALSFIVVAIRESLRSAPGTAERSATSQADGAPEAGGSIETPSVRADPDQHTQSELTGLQSLRTEQA